VEGGEEKNSSAPKRDHLAGVRPSGSGFSSGGRGERSLSALSRGIKAIREREREASRPGGGSENAFAIEKRFYAKGNVDSVEGKSKVQGLKDTRSTAKEKGPSSSERERGRTAE